METMNTDTPETDGEWNRLAYQDHPKFERNLADFARKLERERDELLAGMQIIAREGGDVGHIASQFLPENVPAVAPATLEPESNNDVMAG